MNTIQGWCAKATEGEDTVDINQLSSGIEAQKQMFEGYFLSKVEALRIA